MRILTTEQIDYIKSNYTADAAEAMLNPESADKVLAYVERAAEQGVVITYAQAFWANKGTEVYFRDNQLRVFADSSVGGLQPLNEASAKGDWREWLKRAWRAVRVEGWSGKEVLAKKIPARIIAQCDPYNSKFHYNGQKVLKWDGTTPIEWVVEEYASIEEAREALWKMCLKDAGRNPNWAIEDDDLIAAEKEELLEYEEDLTEEDMPGMFSWYEGEGVYYNNGNGPVMLKGGEAYSNDPMTYRVDY